MNIKSRRIRERHIAVDVLASLVGAGLFYAAINRSWIVGVISVVLCAVLGFLDRESIENEEKRGQDN